MSTVLGIHVHKYVLVLYTLRLNRSLFFFFSNEFSSYSRQLGEKICSIYLLKKFHGLDPASLSQVTTSIKLGISRLNPWHYSQASLWRTSLACWVLTKWAYCRALRRHTLNDIDQQHEEWLLIDEDVPSAVNETDDDIVTRISNGTEEKGNEDVDESPWEPFSRGEMKNVRDTLEKGFQYT